MFQTIKSRAQTYRVTASHRPRVCAAAALACVMLTGPEVLAASAEAAVPAVGSSLPTVSVLPLLGNLALILILIAGGGWLLRRARLAGSTGDSRLRVIASQPLGPREKIVVVEIGDQQLVVGLTPSSINTLHVPPTPLVVLAANETARFGAFAEKLRQAMARGKS